MFASFVINAGQVHMSMCKDGGLGGLCPEDALVQSCHVHVVLVQDGLGHWCAPHVDSVITMIWILPPERSIQVQHVFDGFL